MKPWLRQHRYACRVAVRRLIKQPFSSLANIFVIALSLMLPLMGAAILSSTQPLVDQLHVDPQITLFLTRDSNSTQRDRLAQRLHTEHSAILASLRIVTREQALDDFKRNPDWAQALESLTENPLPDAIIVTLRQDDANPSAQAQRLVQQWQAWEAVDRVQLDSDWLQRVHAILATLRLTLTLLALGVGIVVLATTFNTVRLQALQQREEIKVARLVGATESFVRRPFLYLGALSGIVSSLLAFALTAAACMPLNTALAQLLADSGAALVLRLPPISSLLLALISIIALCALAARWSVTRTTRY